MEKEFNRIDAFNLMKEFLERYWTSTGKKSEDIAVLLGSLGKGGKEHYLPIDMAHWQDWNALADGLEQYEGPE